MSGKAVIESVARGVERLIAENRKLRAEVERLEASRERLRDENRRLGALTAEHERRLTVKGLAQDFGGSTTDEHGKKLARARVGRLMREVDRCIALLNKD